MGSGGAREAAGSAARIVLQRALKRAALSVLKALLALFGGWGLAAVAVLVLLVFGLSLAMGALGAGDQNLDGNLDASDRAVSERYRRASESTAPDGVEAYFRVPWELLRGIDAAMAAGGSEGCRAEEAARALAPRFEYRESSQVTRVYKKDGTVEESREEVRLPVKADTYRGVYRLEYEREREEGLLDTGERYVRERDVFRRMVPVSRGYGRLRVYLGGLLGRPCSQGDLDAVLWFAGAAEGRVAGGVGSPGEVPSALLPEFQAAGAAHGVPWAVLCAIGWVESRFDPDAVGPPNYTGELARGMMQFLPSTWRRWGTDADGDGVASPYSPVDAIWSAARYLEACGAREDLYRAVFSYNHADWYVQEVLDVAAWYEGRFGGGS